MPFFFSAKLFSLTIKLTITLPVLIGMQVPVMWIDFCGTERACGNEGTEPS